MSAPPSGDTLIISAALVGSWPATAQNPAVTTMEEESRVREGQRHDIIPGASPFAVVASTTETVSVRTTTLTTSKSLRCRDQRSRWCDTKIKVP